MKFYMKTTVFTGNLLKPSLKVFCSFGKMELFLLNDLITFKNYESVLHQCMCVCVCVLTQVCADVCQPLQWEYLLNWSCKTAGDLS